MEVIRRFTGPACTREILNRFAGPVCTRGIPGHFTGLRPGNPLPEKRPP